MKLERSIIKFELPDKDIEVDVLQAKLDIEKIQEEHSEDAEAIIDRVKDMFDEFDVKLSTSQAWQAIQAIESAYESVKKKLSGVLESDFGIVPTLLRYPTGQSNGSTDSSHSSLQSESCNIGTEKVNSPATG